MKFTSLTTVCVVCAVLCAAETARAQQTQDLFFRQPARSARSIGVGDATVADVHSAVGVASNPATAAFLESVSADLTAFGRSDGRQAQLDASVPLASTETFGAVVDGYSSAFNRTTWTNKGGMLYGAAVSCAARVTPTISVGGVYLFQSATLGSSSVTSQGAGVGVLYSVLPSLTYAVAVTGLGTALAYRQNDSATAIEREIAPPRSITLGAAYHYPTMHDRVVFNYFLSGSKIIGINQNVYRMGVELFPWKFLALRGGIVSGPVTSVGRAGIGIRTSFIEIDYAITSSSAEDRMHIVTCSIPLLRR